MLTDANWHTASFGDVAEHVKEHPYEDPVLEYKLIPEAQDGRGIAKSLSAFANTFGGWLIVGVTGSDGKYQLGGLQRASGSPRGAVRQRIIDSCLDAIWPPLLDVDPWEIDASDGSGSFCVISRVAPSANPPHFLRGPSRRGGGYFDCYVRAHGRNYEVPRVDKHGIKNHDVRIDLATDLPELLGRRQQVIDRRRMLVETARQRCLVWLRQQMAHDPHRRHLAEAVFHHLAHWEVWICPAYPRQVLLDPDRLLEQHKRSALTRSTIPYFTTGGDPSGSDAEPVSGGVRTAWILFPSAGDLSRPFVYLEVGGMGLVYVRMGIQYAGEDPSEMNPAELDSFRCFRVSWQAISRASLLYEESGYVGPLCLAWDAGPKLNWWRLAAVPGSGLCTDHTWTFVPSEELAYRNRDQFLGDAGTTIAQAGKSLLWSFRVSQHLDLWATRVLQYARTGRLQGASPSPLFRDPTP